MVNTTENNVPRETPTTEWIFRCSLCSKTFNSPKALGGHQNAYRTRRCSIKHKITQAVLQQRQLPRPSYGSGHSWPNPLGPGPIGPAQHISQLVGRACLAYRASDEQFCYYAGVGGPNLHPGVGSLVSNGSKAEIETLDLTLKLESMQTTT